MGRNGINSKTKVLFIIPSLTKGGAERVLSILLEYLDRSRIQPSCIFYFRDEAYKIPDDVKIYMLNIPGTNSLIKKIYLSTIRIFKLKKIIELERPDVVFSFFHTVNLAVIITKLLSTKLYRNVKWFISERTTPSLGIKGELKRIHGLFAKCLMKLLYPKADKIIVNSNGIKKDLVDNFKINEEKICVIYNPVDIAKINMLSNEETVEHSWFNDTIPVIISVGSLSKPKAQDNLLKAFKIVRKKTRARLVFLGEGEKERELKQLSTDLGIDKDVVFLGFQKNPFKFTSKASVFVLSSIWEGFPNVLIEAMACGTPVISTSCDSGPKEIIEDSMNGLLVPVDDTEKMAEAIFKTINDKDFAASMASEAKTSVSKFDVKSAIKDYERLFVTDEKLF